MASGARGIGQTTSTAYSNGRERRKPRVSRLHLSMRPRTPGVPNERTIDEGADVAAMDVDALVPSFGYAPLR